MSSFDPGPGFYIVGCTLGVDGGALAVLQRKHVRITPTPKPIVRGTYVPQRTLEEAEREAWQSRFTLRHVEAFAADRPRIEFVGRVRTLVGQPPLDGESTVIVDTTDLGLSLREQFYSGVGKGNHVYPISITRETTSSAQQDGPSLADVRGAIIALHEAGRLKVAEKIPHRNEVARVIEHAARGDDLPRLALAVGLACHHAKGGWARGPWEGRQRPKPGSPEAYELEAFTMLQRELAQLRQDNDESQWCPPWFR